MHLVQARRILGEEAIGVPDTVLLEDIKTAELLKNFFFEMLVSGKLKKQSDE